MTSRSNVCAGGYPLCGKAYFLTFKIRTFNHAIKKMESLCLFTRQQALQIGYFLLVAR